MVVVLQREMRPFSTKEILKRATLVCAGIGAATVFRALTQLL